MKNALIFGGGSKNASIILDTLIEQGYNIYNIGSSIYEHPQVTNIEVKWNELKFEHVPSICKKITGQIDFVFFNQNSSSLCSSDFSLDHDDLLRKWKLIKDWSNSLWISCQLPFLVIHTIRNKLTENSKIGWMLSSYIDHEASGVAEHPDYSSFKFFNFLAMKKFSSENNLSTFGILPNFDNNNASIRLKNIIIDVLTTTTKNKIYKFNL